MFEVIDTKIAANVLDYSECTLHERNRSTRKEVIALLGDLIKVESFIVNTGHPAGLELHTVYANGVIAIGNIRKESVVTYLIARPGQIRRYGLSDADLLAVAYENYKNGLNLL